MALKDGGPAFPMSGHLEEPRGSGHQNLTLSGGMSLRDYFAGQALAGRLAKLPEIPITELARLAYEMADAMITARAKSERPNT